MSGNVVINIIRNEPEEEDRTWSCMPQVSGMAVSICILLAFEIVALVAVNVTHDVIDRYVVWRMQRYDGGFSVECPSDCLSY